MTLLERLSKLELLVVTGKGGVGKSTLTAALGRLLVRAGNRVLLLEIDPRESLYPLLGVEPSGGDVVRASSGLYVQNLDPREVIHDIVREHLRVEMLVRKVLASPVYRQFTEGAPGLKEVAALGHAIRVVRGEAGSDVPRVDTVVLDAPATGHGVSLLAAPLLLSEVIEEGPIGKLGRELASFISDAERSGTVVATLAEEMPVQEAIELIGALQLRLRRKPELVLVNGLYPPNADPPEERVGPEDEPLALWRMRRAVNDRELHRLREVWPGPRVDLPMLPLDRGPELIRVLGEALEGGLSETSWT